MDNYIVINGTRISLTDEQINILETSIKPKRETPFDRVKSKQTYHTIDYDGSVTVNTENDDPYDDKAFKAGNYSTDFNLLKQRALHETLNRLLWRFSMEHGEGKNLWNEHNKHYLIYMSKRTKNPYFLTLDSVTIKIEGATYFSTEEVAKQAIHDIIEPFMEEHPDFVW